MNPVIQTERLGKKFGSVQALIDLALNIPTGAIYALVGANGAGKTTIIKLLMNIYRPTSGSAKVLGIDSNRLAGKSFRNIGYVSENQEMPEWMTVAYFLDYLRAFYPRWDNALERQLLCQFDLPLDRKLRHLSRGMRMKAAFTSVLSYRPSLIVLDEPFSGLDPLVRDELIEGLLDRAPETTILLSSHDLAEIESFASHVGYLEGGRMLFSEELAVLTDRFREVVITLDDASAIRRELPKTWLRPEISGSVIRFIDSDYRGERTAVELAEIFPTARDISFNPMSLRSIFLSVARSSRMPSEPKPTEEHVTQERAQA
jgi:ABC-2 type transport system ATP-binding protein